MIPMNSKKVFDSVHGFIHLDNLETDLIHTRVFQRLHYIHQLGVAYLVYPGGTHHRYEHSLGVMKLATEVYDHLIISTYDITIMSNFETTLFKEVPKFMSVEYEYWRKIVRAAALCHDVGHLPFSHAAEKALLDEGGHEKWTAKIIQSKYLRPFWKRISEENMFMRKSPEDVESDILKTAIGESDLKQIGITFSFTPWEKILSQIITADFFGADRIDYLLRDSKYTGITYGLFDYHQLIEMLRILPVTHMDTTYLSLGIEEEGIESCEALLISRYFMRKRICHYSTVKAYTWHLRCFMQQCYSHSAFLTDLEHYITFTEHEVFAEMAKAEKDPSHPGHLHAVSFFNHDKKCKAIALPSPVNQEILQKAIKDLEMPKEQIAWESNSGELDFQTTLDFPVLRKDSTIVPCSQLSTVTVPIASSSWIYVPSVYEKFLRQSLGT
jgi:uncharacterized protein